MTIEGAVSYYEGQAVYAKDHGYPLVGEWNGQIAAWLRELKERRKHGLMQGCYGCRHNPFEEEAYCRMCKRMCLDKYEKDGENHDT